MQTSRFQAQRARATAAWLALFSPVALLAGCAAYVSGDGTAGTEAIASGGEALIGGSPAAPDQFRSTVGIGDSCTAAKVAPRLFLTAAHCVAVGRPSRAMPPPEDFPPNGGISDGYLPGASVHLRWGLDATDGAEAQLSIVNTSIHPSWWTCPLCQDPIFSPGGGADVAVVEVAEDTPDIPEASIELGTIGIGTAVIKVGWGCEDRTNVDGNTVKLGRYKTAQASVIDVSEIRRFDGRMTDEQVAEVDAGYVITAGHDQDAASASLCLGDSGGPLYLAGGGAPRIVGVNSNYTFRPVDSEEEGGVSWTDWHTRTSLGSLHGIGQWLRDLGVNAVDSGL